MTLNAAILDNLPKAWRDILLPSLSPKDWEKIKELETFLQKEEVSKTIFPPKNARFKALELCSPSTTKVIILGQDPYHGEGQAMGLSFSVPKEQKLPPSLKNIYKELSEDIGIPVPTYGDLTAWAQQGVLLLNTVLTVEKSKAGAHQKKGWEIITKKILQNLNDNYSDLVFILWGSPAQKTASFIDEKKHLVIKSVHPSPLSSYRGFFGSRPFSQCNKFLSEKGQDPINWSL